MMVGSDYIYAATILGVRDCESLRHRYHVEDHPLHVEVDRSDPENGFAKLDELEG